MEELLKGVILGSDDDEEIENAILHHILNRDVGCSGIV
jgi:hypothetical protein